MSDSTTEDWKKIDVSRMRKAELRNALVRRALTDEELLEVGVWGSWLLVPFGQKYTQAEIDAEFQAMLTVQLILQVRATKRGG